MEGHVITQEKIEQWMREVEERPSSAPLIIQVISSRLAELTRRNADLLAENIELATGKKVDEYESRINKLEYQVRLLKSQVRGEMPLAPDAAPVENLNLLVYTSRGRVLRLELAPAALLPGQEIARFAPQSASGEPAPALLVTGAQEELLCVFDSGRTATLAVTEIPALHAGGLDWQQAFLQQPHAGEELALIHPISRLPLFEFCMQASRRGFVKKTRVAALESFLANSYIGTGVKLPADKMCSLAFGDKNDHYVMVSREGFLFCMDVERLPAAIEEALRLGVADHVVATFIIGQNPSILIMTQAGKVIHREAGWLEPSTATRTRGQPAFSKERRESGVRVVGAAAVDAQDWVVVAGDDGRLVVYRAASLLDAGSLPGDNPPGQVTGFATFRLQA
jgi:DNA gyrase/topoisomerase IV subunit A